MSKKPVKPVADERDPATRPDASLRAAYKRIEAEPPPQGLLAAFERLIGARKGKPRN